MFMVLSSLIKKLMQTYIVIVAGSILNVSTVHLNGIWHLIWRYLSKPVLGGHPVLSGHYSIRRGCPLNTGFTVPSKYFLATIYFFLKKQEPIRKRLNLCYYKLPFRDGPLIFWRGGRGWKFSHGNIFYMRLLLQTIFFVSPSSCKHFHFFLLAYNLFQCSKFSNLPPPPAKK